MIPHRIEGINQLLFPPFFMFFFVFCLIQLFLPTTPKQVLFFLSNHNYRPQRLFLRTFSFVEETERVLLGGKDTIEINVEKSFDRQPLLVFEKEKLWLGATDDHTLERWREQ